YGPETVEVVREFQAYYGLVENGIIDSITETKINSILNNPYQLGNSSLEIQQIKTKLKTLGFADHWKVPNNDYGSETVEVVKSFQTYYGLVVNGILDSVSENRINSILNSPYQLGN